MESNTLPETLSWKAPSHQNPHRPAGWYLGFSAVAVLLMLFAIFYDTSIITILTFALLIVVVFIMTLQPARTITYKITKSGLMAGRTIYPYKIVKKFWILYNPPDIKTLNFQTSSYLNNQVAFELGDMDPLKVKLVLGQYLPEDLEKEESLSEVLARKLKI